MAGVSREDLTTLAGMIEAGQLEPIVDRIYPFEKPDAVRHLESGGAIGKVVVTMRRSGSSDEGDDWGTGTG